MNASPIKLKNLKSELKDYQAFRGDGEARKALFSKLISCFLSTYKKVSISNKVGLAAL